MNKSNYRYKIISIKSSVNYSCQPWCGVQGYSRISKGYLLRGSSYQKWISIQFEMFFRPFLYIFFMRMMSISILLGRYWLLPFMYIIYRRRTVLPSTRLALNQLPISPSRGQNIRWLVQIPSTLHWSLAFFSIVSFFSLTSLFLFHNSTVSTEFCSFRVLLLTVSTVDIT